MGRGTSRPPATHQRAARSADSPIREELVIAPDTWSEAAPPEADRLLAVANLADANAWSARPATRC